MDKSTEELNAAISERDGARAGAIVAPYRGKLVRSLSGRRNSLYHCTPEDLAGEAIRKFMKAINRGQDLKFPSVDPDALNYILTIARNHCHDERRKSLKRPLDLASGPCDIEVTKMVDPTTAKEATASDWERIYESIQQRLSTDDRRVLECWADGLSGKEGAEKLGILPATYRKRLHDLRKKIERISPRKINAIRDLIED